jgi:hypothetical protein
MLLGMTNPAQPIPPPQATIPAPPPEDDDPQEDVIDGLKTLKDVGLLINEKCDYEVSELPRIDFVFWYTQKSGIDVSLLMQTMIATVDAGVGEPQEKEATKQAQGNALMGQMVPTTFFRLKPCPLGPDWFVTYIFRESEELRVYCLRLNREGGDINNYPLIRDAEGNPARAARYSLNPDGYQFAYETMPISTWLGEVIGELDTLGLATFGEVDETEPETAAVDVASLPQGPSIIPGVSNGH